MYVKWIIVVGAVALVIIVSGALYAFTVLFAAPGQEQVNTSNAQETSKNVFVPDGTNDTVEDSPSASDLVSVPSSESQTEHEHYERFVVPLDTTEDTVVNALAEEGFITNRLGFSVALATRGGTIEPGAYRLAKTMNAFEVAGALTTAPYMKWVVVQEGLRKEEIAEKLATALGWTDAEKQEWIMVHTEADPAYVEGVYFPETYLIPVNESPEAVADRLITTFNEHFGPYLARFNAQNIRWTTGLTLASLVQREAANEVEMPLIAGILWNRLDEGMYLNVDATLQYARGNTGSGWWAPITTAEKQLDSPFNTYTYRGLPPHPIANPGIPAIEATLNPEKTECFYYLHDADGTLHCAATYEEHQENIEKHL